MRSHGYSAGNWSTHNTYHSDANGSVTALVNSSGVLQASYKYNPYGGLISSIGALASANTMRFSSNPAIFSTSGAWGFYSYGYRFYDPLNQRWLNRDPIEEKGGLNLNSYVANRPNESIDPLGLTFVVSPDAFPGQEGTCGPYVAIVNDGSKRVKSAKHLTEEELNAELDQVCDRFKRKPWWHACNPLDQAGAGHTDTNFNRGGDADQREYYLLGGLLVADNELNYIGIGAYEAWKGSSFLDAQKITCAWKLIMYRGEWPSQNTMLFLRIGYVGYRSRHGNPFKIPVRWIP